MRIALFLYSLKFIGEIRGKTVVKDMTHILHDWGNVSAEKLNYNLSQNCWATFVSSRPLNVGVHDLVTESQ